MVFRTMRETIGDLSFIMFFSAAGLWLAAFHTEFFRQYGIEMRGRTVWSAKDHGTVERLVLSAFYYTMFPPRLPRNFCSSHKIFSNGRVTARSRRSPVSPPGNSTIRGLLCGKPGKILLFLYTCSILYMVFGFFPY